MMYASVLTYHDRSGIVGMWGPYATEELAQAVIDTMESWPLQYGGFWTIEKLHPFGTEHARLNPAPPMSTDFPGTPRGRGDTVTYAPSA